MCLLSTGQLSLSGVFRALHFILGNYGDSPATATATGSWLQTEEKQQNNVFNLPWKVNDLTDIWHTYSFHRMPRVDVANLHLQD